MNKTIKEMNRKELEDAYNAMRLRYNSMVDANINISNNLDKCLNTIKQLEQLIKRKDLKIEVDKVLLQELADNQNAQKDAMAEEIRLLKSKIKELENGDNS